MPQFRDINVFIEKSSLDGSEEVQVSGTQKAKLVKLLEQLGENLQMSVPDKDRQTFPALGTTGKVQAWLSALAYACGIREMYDSEQDTFRFLHGDNINASATTLAVTVGGSPSFNTVNKYLRDAVISVAYNAAVTFSAQNSTVVVRKSADIDTVTASSGKKVYTIHWSPLAVQNGIVSRWEAYVNVAVYV